MVLDTHALLWWSFQKDKLSDNVVQLISSNSEIKISAISVWEIGVKVQKEHIKIPHTMEEYVEKIKNSQGFEIESVDEAIWLQALKLDWDHKDPADRVIVATAIKHDAPLVTSDARIKEFYSKAIW